MLDRLVILLLRKDRLYKVGLVDGFVERGALLVTTDVRAL